MLRVTLTHYWPADDDAAACGAAPDDHALSASPTCRVCAQAREADDAMNGREAEAALVPLTDDDARYAGVPVAASLAGDVLAYATHLTRTYAAMVRTTEARRQRMIGGRR